MSSQAFRINIGEFEELQKAMTEYTGNVEEVINDVLHNEGGQLLQDSIRRLIPVSGRDWKGKGKAAKSGNSLTNVNANLSVTVTTTKKYQYLYFPDDGTSTKKHVGNKQFFATGAENVKNDIIERCIGRLINIE